MLNFVKPMLLGAGLTMAYAGMASAETLRMASAYPESNYHTKNIQQFIEDVKTATGGDVDIQLSSSSSLYKAPEIMEAVETGQVQLGEVLYAVYGNENPLYDVDGIMYIISGYDQARKLYDATRPLIEADMKERGLTLLYSAPWPGIGIFSKDAIEDPSEIEGLRMRSPSPAIAKWAERLGMNNVVVQMPELTQALSSGMVNAVATSSPVAPAVQFWDYVKYFYPLDAMHAKNGIVINTAALERLSKEDRKALFEAAAKAEERGWAVSAKEDRGYRQQMIDNGMTVEPISPEVEAVLRAKADEQIAEWLAIVPEDLRTAVESVRN